MKNLKDKKKTEDCCGCHDCKCCEQMKAKFEEERKNLVNTIDQVEDEKLVIKEQLAGALADYQNLEKKMIERINLRSFQTKKSICEELLPSLDSLIIAINTGEKLTLDDNSKAWLEGIKATMQSMIKGLNGIGLQEYLPQVGDSFDPNTQEALVNIESKDVQAGCVVEVVQPGYTLDGIIIRHARVVVSK